MTNEQIIQSLTTRPDSLRFADAIYMHPDRVDPFRAALKHHAEESSASIVEAMIPTPGPTSLMGVRIVAHPAMQENTGLILDRQGNILQMIHFA